MAIFPSLCSLGVGVYARGGIIYPPLPLTRGWRLTTLRTNGARRKARFMALDQDSLTQLLDTVERFVQERLRPMEREVAESDRIPDHIAAETKEPGLFGLSIPE